MGDLGQNLKKWAYGHKLHLFSFKMSPRLFRPPNDKCLRCNIQNSIFGIFGKIALFMGVEIPKF